MSIRGTILPVNNIQEMVQIDANGSPITGTLSSQELRVTIGGINISTISEGGANQIVAATQAGTGDVFVELARNDAVLTNEGHAMEVVGGGSTTISSENGRLIITSTQTGAFTHQWPDSFTEQFTVPSNSIWFYNDEYWIFQSDLDLVIQTSGDFDVDAPSAIHLSWRLLTAQASDWPASFPGNFVLHHDQFWDYERTLWQWVGARLQISSEAIFDNNKPSDTNQNWLRITGVPNFDTSDAWETFVGTSLQLDDFVIPVDSANTSAVNTQLRARYNLGDIFFIETRDDEYQVVETSGNYALQVILTSRSSISDLADVSDTAPTNSYVLTWNDTTSMWEPQVGGSGIQVLASDPDSPSEGQVWYSMAEGSIRWYDGSTAKSTFEAPEGWGFQQENNAFIFGPFDSSSNLISANNAYFIPGEGIDLVETNPNPDNQSEGLRIDVDTDTIATRGYVEGIEQDIEDQLTRNPSDSQAYYQFAGLPTAFTNTDGDSAGSGIAFDDNFSVYQELSRSAQLAGGTTPSNSQKVILKYGSNANEFREYLIVLANFGSFYIADGTTVAHYQLENLEDGFAFYSAASSGATNGGITGLYESKLWLGNSRGAIVEIPHGSLFDGNGNLQGRTLPKVTGQGDSDYYAVHTLATGDNSPVYGLDYFYNGAGNAALIAGNREGRVFRLRSSGASISFDAGGILTAEMGDYTIPTSDTFTTNKFAIRGIKSFTLEGADALTDGPTFDNGSRLYVIYGDTAQSRSGNFPIPGIAIANNLHSISDADFSTRGTARVPGGNDPSEQYVGYTGNSATFDPELDMTIFDVDYYSDESTDQYLLFVGEQNGVAPASQAQMWYCDIDENSLWQPERLPSNNYKARIGSPIYSVSHGPSLASSGNGVWLGTGNGAVWSIPNDTANLGDVSGNAYGDDELLQVLSDPSDSTSDPITTGTIRGFDVFGLTQDAQATSVYAAGVNSDGHVVRWDLQPDITVTVRHANIDHVATFNYTGDAAAVQTFFANKANYTPNLPVEVNVSTVQPNNQPAGQLYIEYSVSNGDIPGITVTHTGALIATDTAFASNQPWRTFSETATTVTVTFPSGGYVFTTTLSSDVADATAQRAVEQVVDTLNANSHGITAEILDEDFNPSITMETPVLLINQPGVVPFSLRPTIAITQANTLVSRDFADGAFDTIGAEGGLFNPNDYYTKPQVDAKIDAIEVIGGGGASVIPNTGTANGNTNLFTTTIDNTAYNIQNEADLIRGDRVITYDDNGTTTQGIAIASTARFDNIRITNASSESQLWTIEGFTPVANRFYLIGWGSLDLGLWAVAGYGGTSGLLAVRDRVGLPGPNDAIRIAQLTVLPTGGSGDNTAATQAYFSGLGPFVGGTRDSATNANFVKTGLTVPGSTVTTAYYFSSDKSWRETDASNGTLLGRFGG